MTEKIEPQSQRWIEAIRILGLDPKATVACPECGQGTLRVFETRMGGDRLARDMQCTVCHRREVLTAIRPGGAIKLFVLSDRELSSVTEWQAMIDSEGYPLRLDTNEPIAALSGFLPARLRDIKTGFDCNPWRADRFLREMPGVDFGHAWKHVLALRWNGNNLRERPAVWMAATAYARATDGVVFDEEARSTRTADKARIVVERIERDMPWTEALERHFTELDSH
jgi:hypothetical protein